MSQHKHHNCASQMYTVPAQHCPRSRCVTAVLHSSTHSGAAFAPVPAACPGWFSSCVPDAEDTRDGVKLVIRVGSIRMSYVAASRQDPPIIIIERRTARQPDSQTGRQAGTQRVHCVHAHMCKPFCSSQTYAMLLTVRKSCLLGSGDCQPRASWRGSTWCQHAAHTHC
jgi:hypothetical protein